jgi:hypothetical protein
VVVSAGAVVASVLVETVVSVLVETVVSVLVEVVVSVLVVVDVVVAAVMVGALVVGSVVVGEPSERAAAAAPLPKRATVASVGRSAFATTSPDYRRMPGIAVIALDGAGGGVLAANGARGAPEPRFISRL